MKSKNKLNKIIVFLLLLTVIAMIFVANTYSKYATNASGSDSVVVAKWSFFVNGKEIAVKGNPETIDFNLFETIYDSDGENEETDVAEGFIAPGTSGAFEFALQNTSEVTAQYAINLTVDNTDIPLEFSFDAETWTDDLSNLVAQDNLAIGTSKNVKVMWRWAFGADTETDISLSEQTVNVSATITAIQVDNGNNVVGYIEKQLFTDIENAMETTAIANMKDVAASAGPYAYQDSNMFSGKTITKIGIPVKSVSDVNTPQTFTVYVVDKEPLSILTDLKPTTVAQTYTLTLPSEQLGDTTTVNKMVYVDVNISLADNQTLAFASENDTITWGFINYKSTIVSDQYKFIAGILNSPATNNGNIILDIYVKEEIQNETPDDETETPLKTALTGKNFSILGDSISTFEGYSNNATTTNNTIGSNSVYYPYESPITDVNMTWWMQAANETGMNVLVNNSWSGDTIAKRGITRAMQLHDNTGDNADTNPDIVAVYMGVNDVKNTANLSTNVFSENYTTMITNIKTTYPDADVFVFTLLPYTAPNATVPSMGADEIEVYNQVIRTVASENGCTVVDLFNDSGITEDNYKSDYMWDDGLHPNAAGMDAITNTFINALSAKYLNN